MANLIGKAMGFKIDNSSASLTDISDYVNSQSLQFAVNILQDTGMGDAKHTTLQGIAQPTKIPLNGWVNTTTDALFGPQIATATSVTKTFEYRTHATNSTGTVGRFYNGEVLLSNIQYSGSVDNMQTFSADMTVDGAVNRTTASLGGT